MAKAVVDPGELRRFAIVIGCADGESEHDFVCLHHRDSVAEHRRLTIADGCANRERQLRLHRHGDARRRRVGQRQRGR